MPLKKYACMPSGRMAAYFAVASYGDLAVIDFSTEGHGLYNHGHIPWLLPQPTKSNLFTTHITETDLALGDASRLSQTAKEVAAQKYACAVIIPSAIGGMLGYDFCELAERASAESGLDIFTFPLKLYDDFYKGGEAVTSALARKFCVRKAEKRKGAFVVLGGGYTQFDRRVNSETEKLISRTFGHKCLFDNLNAVSVKEWGKCLRAECIAVTSRNALPAAEYLRKTFGIPYMCFRSYGKTQEDQSLQEWAALTETEFAPVSDKCYDGVFTQFSNIVKATQPEIVCYADADRLHAVKRFFAEFGVQTRCYCSHAQDEEEYMDVNDFIDLYSKSDAVVLSYDSVCRHVKRGVALEYTGQHYNLLTPICLPQLGKDGSYVLMQKISSILL